jgi:phytoene dehydrogenase-like protein
MNTQNIQNLDNPTPAATPEAGVHTQEAEAMLDRVEAWRKEIPTFAFPVPKGDRRLQSAARAVPPDLLEQTAVAMKSIDALSRGNNDAGQQRDLLQYAIAFGPVAAAIVRLGAEMQHSVDVARAKAGTEALVTFHLAERLAKVPGNEDLIPVVAEMRRTLSTVPRFRGPRKAKKDGPQQPVDPAKPAPAPIPDPHTTN